MPNEKLNPELYFISLDETENWNFQPEDKTKIKKVESIYVFDKNCVVHCCEITPSYELNFIQTRALFTDEAYANDDEGQEFRDHIDELIMSESNSAETLYMHCYRIHEQIVVWEATGVKPKNLERYQTHAKFDPEYETFSQWYEDLLETAMAYARGNWVL